METMGFWRSLWFMLSNPYTWTQCKASLKVGKSCWAICQKRRCHFGPHITNDGVEFMGHEPQQQP